MRAFIFFIMVICLAGCKQDPFCNCLKKAGDELTEVRKTPNFNSIEMTNNVDVIVTPDTICGLSVTCGKNLVDGIKTEVIDGVLYISNKNKCNWLRDFKNQFIVNVSVADLRSITNRGSGNLSFSDTLKRDEFLLENWSGSGELNVLLNCNTAYLKLHTGPADIIANGRVGICYVYSAGNGYFKGYNLSTDYCYVTTKSTGDCQVNATKVLEATISYNGNVYYEGNPEKIVSEITGQGQLIKH